jgi:hypothetical protein
MGGSVKATVVGTIIIGIFMVICTKMVTNSAFTMARSVKNYVEAQKLEAKRIVKAEKAKAKETYLMGTGVVKVRK